jgi:thiamine pyrophosphate-dependent acetolactate synthase large subunit-like protein
MADAFARITGRVPAVSVHQGPGLTNLVTGLAEAAKARTPLLVLAGDTAGAAVRSNFRIDQAGLAASVGAIVERIHSPASATADAARAYHRARAERRPVLLNLPLDVQAAPAPADSELRPEPHLRAPEPAAEAVREAAALLGAAERPLLIAGRGAVMAGARAPLEHLGDRLGALLATSAAGHGLFTGSPWALGISGGFASPTAARLIAEADVVAAFGATLNMWTTRHGHLLSAGTKVIQVDLDPEIIGANQPADVALVGDAAAAARLIADALPRGTGASWRTPQLAEAIAHGTWNTESYDDRGGHGHIDPRTLTRRLDEILPIERIVAIDSGHFMGWPAMYLRVPDERGFVFAQAFQAVGLGLASAIGAAIARPDRLTVAALGDGGVLMGASELETVAKMGLRMLIVVYNDAAFGAEVHHFGPHGDPLDIVRFPDTDIAALGRGAGLEAVTVKQAGDLDAVAEWVGQGSPRPMLVDAKVAPDVVGEWLEEAFRGH